MCCYVYVLVYYMYVTNNNIYVYCSYQIWIELFTKHCFSSKYRMIYIRKLEFILNILKWLENDKYHFK